MDLKNGLEDDSSTTRRKLLKDEHPDESTNQHLELSLRIWTMRDHALHLQRFVDGTTQQGLQLATAEEMNDEKGVRCDRVKLRPQVALVAAFVDH